MRVSMAARQRMVRVVRAALRRGLTGGELWFGSDGHGGAWYSGNAMPPDPDTIIVRLRPGADPADLVESAVESWQAQR